MTVEDDNPYRSPRAAGDGLLRERVWKPGAQSRLLARGLLYRRVQLEAPIEAILEFNGRSLRDIIKIDNQIVASRISWWRITPRFEFALPLGDQMLPVEVCLRLGSFLRILGFRVRIGDVVAYQEGAL